MMAFKNNIDAQGFCWSRFANVYNGVMGNDGTNHGALLPSQCTNNGFYYVNSDVNSLSGADANPFLRYHSEQDFRIITTAYSDIWLQQIATDFRSEHVYARRRENGVWYDWVKLANANDLAGASTPSNMMTTDTAQTITGAKAFTGQVGNTQSSAGVYLGLDTNASAPNANIAIVSANTASYIDMGAPNEDYGFRIIKWKGTSGDVAQFTYGGGGTITVPNATGTMALTSQIPNITASTTDIGEGSSLASGTLYLVYE